MAVARHIALGSASPLDAASLNQASNSASGPASDICRRGQHARVQSVELRGNQKMRRQGSCYSAGVMDEANPGSYAIELVLRMPDPPARQAGSSVREPSCPQASAALTSASSSDCPAAPYDTRRSATLAGPAAGLRPEPPMRTHWEAPG